MFIYYICTYICIEYSFYIWKKKNVLYSIFTFIFNVLFLIFVFFFSFTYMHYLHKFYSIKCLHLYIHIFIQMYSLFVCSGKCLHYIHFVHWTWLKYTYIRMYVILLLQCIYILTFLLWHVFKDCVLMKTELVLK